MTNDEYLRALANDGPDKLAAWMRAEHVDGQPLEVTLTVRGEPREIGELALAIMRVLE